jgi:hypothetical protein
MGGGEGGGGGGVGGGIGSVCIEMELLITGNVGDGGEAWASVADNEGRKRT